MVFVETSFPRGGIEKTTVDSSQPRTEIVSIMETKKKNSLTQNKTLGIWSINVQETKREAQQTSA